MYRERMAIVSQGFKTKPTQFSKTLRSPFVPMIKIAACRMRSRLDIEYQSKGKAKTRH